MTLLVDPPQRNRGSRGGGATNSGAVRATDQLDGPPGRTHTAPNLAESPPKTAEPVKLAEPPILAGRRRGRDGRVIVPVLSRQPAGPSPARRDPVRPRPRRRRLRRPLRHHGQAASVATPRSCCRSRAVARVLGAPHLPNPVADLIMYLSIGLCCLGLAMMLWANSQGLVANPRRVFAVGRGARWRCW